VQQRQIRDGDHLVVRHASAPAVGRPHQEPAPIDADVSDALDQLVDAVGSQDGVLVARHVALVGDLEDHVAHAAAEEPARDLLDSADDRRLIPEPLVLPEVEQAEDHHHAELVGAVENPNEPLPVGRLQAAVGRERRAVPGLGPGVALGAPPLQAHREPEQPVGTPLGHGGDEFLGIALRIPAAGVGVCSSRSRPRIGVVEDALH
jgi:hypothetical protein